MWVLCDNVSTINIMKNSFDHSRIKHIEVKHYFIRDHIVRGDIALNYIKFKSNLVDIFIKLFSQIKFSHL